MLGQAEAKAVVERYLRDVLGGTDPAALEELVDNAALRQKAKSFRAAFPELAITTHVVLSDGRFVAVHFSARGTHLGMFQGIPATGRTWTASCSALYRVEDGRIVDFWINWDMLAILEQLGALDRRAGVSA